MKMLKKMLASIIILTMITYILSSILIQNKSLAVTQSTSTDINSIDSSKYPGIKEQLQQLKNKHPNWNFKILYTGLDFNEVIANEYTGHGKSPKNLIYKSANYQGAWICSICKERIYDNGNWRCASEEAIKYMIREKNGCIINMSSIWGIVGASCEVAYSITKAGIDGLTKALAKELGPSNIRVNSIAPGTIETEMNTQLSEEEIKEIENETPLGKIGKPKDIAKTIQWLIEDEFTTGQIISPNGGWVI